MENKNSKTNELLNLKESEANMLIAEQPAYEYERDQEINIHISDDIANNCSLHFHNQIEIITVQTESQLVQINDRQVLLHAGEMAIADCFDIHAYTYSGAISTVLVIPNRFLAEFKQYKKERVLKTNFIKDRAVFNICYPLLKKIADAPNPLVQKGLIDYLLGTIVEATELDTPETVKRQSISTIHDILDYVEKNYAEDLNLNNIAKHFFYSPAHFSRLFKSFFQYNITDYINTVRLRKFFEMKEATPDESLITLIMESGFPSVPTFYRFFQKKMKSSPFKYFKR